MARNEVSIFTRIERVTTWNRQASAALLYTILEATGDHRAVPSLTTMFTKQRNGSVIQYEISLSSQNEC